MKIKIYQIDRDKDNGSLSFLNYENTVKRTGGRIRSEIYHKVFDGDVECSGLEDVYAMFNENEKDILMRKNRSPLLFANPASLPVLRISEPN